MEEAGWRRAEVALTPLKAEGIDFILLEAGGPIGRDAGDKEL